MRDINSTNASPTWAAPVAPDIHPQPGRATHQGWSLVVKGVPRMGKNLRFYSILNSKKVVVVVVKDKKTREQKASE